MTRANICIIHTCELLFFIQIDIFLLLTVSCVYKKNSTVREKSNLFCCCMFCFCSSIENPLKLNSNKIMMNSCRRNSLWIFAKHSDRLNWWFFCKQESSRRCCFDLDMAKSIFNAVSPAAILQLHLAAVTGLSLIQQGAEYVNAKKTTWIRRGLEKRWDDTTEERKQKPLSFSYFLGPSLWWVIHCHCFDKRERVKDGESEKEAMEDSLSKNTF